MPRKVLIGLLLAINAIGLIVIIALKMKLNSAKNYVFEFPAFIEAYSSIAAHPDWVIRRLQPRLAGFKTESGRNYLLVESPDIDNKLISQRVFVTGKVNDSEKIEKILLKDNSGAVIAVDFKGLKQRLKKNQQIGIEYFATVPGPETDLGEVCQTMPSFCQLVELANNNQDKLTANRQYIADPKKSFITDS
jgi:hypothetical protein